MEINNLPCKTCITLAICRETGRMTNGVSTLAHKCPILDAHLKSETMDEWRLESIYNAYVFFDRGINATMS